MRFALLLVLAVAGGCGRRVEDAPGDREGVFGPPVYAKPLEPFQGQWVFNPERTAAARKARGEPSIGGGARAPGFVIQGHVATGEGAPSEEYRFFALHEHDGVVCGKAWHHEDRHDPGDMSKCHVKLCRAGDEFHLTVFMHEGLPDLDDPDLNAAPVVAAGPAGCNPPPDDPAAGAWVTYVFVRPR